MSLRIQAGHCRRVAFGGGLITLFLFSCKSEGDSNIYLDTVKHSIRILNQSNTLLLRQVEYSTREAGNRKNDVAAYENMQALLALRSAMNVPSGWSETIDTRALEGYMKKLADYREPSNHGSPGYDLLQSAFEKYRQNTTELNFNVFLLNALFLENEIASELSAHMGLRTLDGEPAKLFAASDTLKIDEIFSAVITTGLPSIGDDFIFDDPQIHVTRPDTTPEKHQITEIGRGAWMIQFSPQSSGEYTLEFVTTMRSKSNELGFGYVYDLEKKLTVID